jgi:hypothetical protein
VLVVFMLVTLFVKRYNRNVRSDDKVAPCILVQSWSCGARAARENREGHLDGMLFSLVSFFHFGHNRLLTQRVTKF